MLCCIRNIALLFQTLIFWESSAWWEKTLQISLYRCHMFCLVEELQTDQRGSPDCLTVLHHIDAKVFCNKFTATGADTLVWFSICWFVSPKPAGQKAERWNKRKNICRYTSGSSLEVKTWWLVWDKRGKKRRLKRSREGRSLNMVV